MLLEASDSEVSTEREEVEKEQLRPSNWTFLPCSFRVVILMSALGYFGFWITTQWILPGGPRRRTSFLFKSLHDHFTLQAPLTKITIMQTPLKPFEWKPYKSEAEGRESPNEVNEDLKKYLELAKELHDAKDLMIGSGCIYEKQDEGHIFLSDKKLDKQQQIEQRMAWTYRIPSDNNDAFVTVSLCKNIVDRSQFHIRSRLSEYETDDVMFQIGGVKDGVAGFTFGRTFWVMGGNLKKKYLLCNMLPKDIESFFFGIPTCQYE